ncbi:MAG: S8 family serine peptidase [Nevskia sp.]|nr:S8 family serine peptidase [Nevskia sp.]
MNNDIDKAGRTAQAVTHRRRARLAVAVLGFAIGFSASFQALAVVPGGLSPAERHALEKRGYTVVDDQRGQVIPPLPAADAGVTGAPIWDIADNADQPNPWPLTAAQLAADSTVTASDFRTRSPDLKQLAALRQAAAARGRVPVIVSLRLLYQPEGLLGAAGARLQQQTINGLQGRVLDRLQGQAYTLARRYQRVPMLAITASPVVLDLLAAHPDVAAIDADRSTAPALADSVPLLGAADIHDIGIKGGNGYIKDSGSSSAFPGVVAVIDTGADTGHIMLRETVGEACFSSTRSCPNGQTSQIGTGAGVQCTFSSRCDHGSHVGGTATGAIGGAVSQLLASRYNGVAPDSRLMPIMVASSQSGEPVFTDSDLIAALEYVYSQRSSYRIAAVNMSLGDTTRNLDPCDSTPLKTIIDSLRSVNIATVISAGNSGFTNGLAYPACISSAVSVGSTDKRNAIAFNSNRSKDVTLFATGVAITSSCSAGSYCEKSGTSMAAPHVAGAFALLRDALPGNTVSQNITALQNTGVTVGSTTRPDGGLKLYQRIYVPAAAGLDVLRLESGVARDRRAPKPNRHAYDYVSNRRYWSAVAVDPGSANLDLRLYEDQGTVVGGSSVTPLVISNAPAGEIEIVAQDHNSGSRPTGFDRVEVSQVTPSTTRYRIEYAGNNTPVLGNTYSQLFTDLSTIQLLDARVTGGETQYLRVKPDNGSTLDLELLAFTSTNDPATWQRGRGDAAAIGSATGSGGDEAISFAASVDGFAGIALLRKSGSGFFTLYRDFSAPIGSVTINSNADSTTTREVTLNLAASDAETGIDSFRVAVDGVNFGAWQPYTAASASTPVTLPPGNGVATVAVQYRNQAFQPSPIYQDSITVNAPMPVAISIDDVRVSENNSGTTTAIFTVRLDRASSSAVTVRYSTADATAAVADGDYLATSSTMTIAAGRTTRTFGVTINGDTRNEADETFFVNLSDATGATIADAQGIGTIANDDAAASVPGIGVQTRSFNFGNVRVGSSSPARALVITSTGTAPLLITGIRVTGDYAGTSNCPRALAPGATCTLTGNFKPTATGARPGSVTITSNAPDSPTVIQLSGTGT